jgi:prevent-host-death family protein
MQTISLQDLRDDAAGVIAAAQDRDILVVDNGKVVAVVSKPPPAAEFGRYWMEREKLLAGVVALPGWDSTNAVSEDRGRA